MESLSIGTSPKISITVFKKCQNGFRTNRFSAEPGRLPGDNVTCPGIQAIQCASFQSYPDVTVPVLAERAHDRITESRGVSRFVSNVTELETSRIIMVHPAAIQSHPDPARSIGAKNEHLIHTQSRGWTRTENIDCPGLSVEEVNTASPCSNPENATCIFDDRSDGHAAQTLSFLAGHGVACQ
jgi:hypothetical protein